MNHHRFFGLLLVVALGTAPLASAQDKKGTDSAAANAVPRLLKNLSSEDVLVAASAARSLGVIFSADDKAAVPEEPVIEALQTALASPRGAELRREAAAALGSMKIGKAVANLKKAMDDEDVKVAIAAAVALGAILPLDDARVYLTQRGKEKSQTVQAAAYEGIAPLARPEDSDFLAVGLTSPNWRVQMNAVKGLERTVRAGASLKPETYDRIAAVLGSEMVAAAEASSHFLIHIGNEESLRAIVAAIDIHGDGGPQDGTWRTRTYALRTLNHFQWPTIRVGIPAVIRQLGDPTSNVTNQVRAIFKRLNKEGHLQHDELFPLLLVELEQAKGVRLRSAIMAEMGSQVANQYASRVAKVAAVSLDEALKDPTAWPLRANSITLLGASGFTGSIEKIAPCVNDDVTNVRSAAGEALAKLSKLCTPEQKAKVATVLVASISNPLDWRKTATAAQVAGDYPAPESIEPLVKLLGHAVLNVREASSHSLVTLAKGEDVKLRSAVEKRILTEIGEQEKSWEGCAKVLGALHKKEAVALLIPVLRRGTWRAQAAAANAIIEIAAMHRVNDQELNEALIRAAQSEILQVQQAANKALQVISQGK